jgi:hypothetical protein
VVSVTDPYGRILGFLDRSHYFFFQVAPQLCIFICLFIAPYNSPVLCILQAKCTQSNVYCLSLVLLNADMEFYLILSYSYSSISVCVG